MDWCIRSLTLILTFIASTALADDFPIHVVAEACMKDKKMQVCKDLKLVKDNAERMFNTKLKEFGLVNSAVIVGTTMQYVINRKLEFKDRTNIPFLGRERTIVIYDNSVIINFIWPINW